MFSYVLRAFCSAAISSVRSVIGSPFDWNSQFQILLRLRHTNLSFDWNISEHKVGTEELAHMEMVCTIIYQLTKDLSPEEIKASGFDKYYVDHTLALWPQAAGGIPFNACEFQSKGNDVAAVYQLLKVRIFICLGSQRLD